MGIFDIFTGKPAKDAAAQNAALFQGYGTQATGALQGAQAAGERALTAGTTAAGGALDTARSDVGGGIGAYGNAIEAYSPLGALGAKYGTGTNLYMNALGINGAGGTAAARDAFTTSPGYEFARDEGIKQAQRSINRFAPGGNEAAEISRLATGYANQEYNNWLTRLGAMAPLELQATGEAARGRAAGYTGQAGEYGKLADIEGTRAGMFTNDAAARVALGRGTASDIANVQANVASGTAGSNTSAANAEMQASGNFWNGLLNLGGAFAGAAFPKPTKAA